MVLLIKGEGSSTGRVVGKFSFDNPNLDRNESGETKDDLKDDVSNFTEDSYS